MKKQVNVRLSGETRLQIDALKESWDTNSAREVIERAIQICFLVAEKKNQEPFKDEEQNSHQ